MTFFLDSNRTSPIALRIINPKDFLTTHFDRKVEVGKMVLNLGTLPFNKMIYSIFNIKCHYQHINISKILKQNVYFLTYTFNFVGLHFSFFAIYTPLVSDWPPVVQVLEVPYALCIACVQTVLQDLRVISLLRFQRYTLDRVSREEAISLMCSILITQI